MLGALPMFHCLFVRAFTLDSRRALKPHSIVAFSLIEEVLGVRMLDIQISLGRFVEIIEICHENYRTSHLAERGCLFSSPIWFLVSMELLEDILVGFLFYMWSFFFWYNCYPVIHYMLLWINSQPDLGWIKRLQQILGRKHQRNLQVCTTDFFGQNRNNIFTPLVLLSWSWFWYFDLPYIGNICSPPDIWT